MSAYFDSVRQILSCLPFRFGIAVYLIQNRTKENIGRGSNFGQNQVKTGILGSMNIIDKVRFSMIGFIWFFLFVLYHTRSNQMKLEHLFLPFTKANNKILPKKKKKTLNYR